MGSPAETQGSGKKQETEFDGLLLTGDYKDCYLCSNCKCFEIAFLDYLNLMTSCFCIETY